MIAEANVLADAFMTGSTVAKVHILQHTMINFGAFKTLLFTGSVSIDMEDFHCSFDGKIVKKFGGLRPGWV